MICFHRACVGLKPQNHMMLEYKHSNLKCPATAYYTDNEMSVEYDLKRKYRDTKDVSTNGVVFATNGVDH